MPGEAAVQEKAEPVVGEVAESEADAFDPLDEEVDCLGGAVRSHRRLQAMARIWVR